MPEITEIVAMLERTQSQLEEIKDALGRLSVEGLGTGEIDLGTGLPPTSGSPGVIPPSVPQVEIVGGEATAHFPDCCAVGNDDGYYCSGILIAPNLVVTADHCEGVTCVFLKGSDVRKPDDGEVIPVISQHSHPEVDLRILILAHNSTVTPRPIATAANLADVTTDIETAHIVGFGHIDLNGSVGYGVKRKVEVPITTIDCGSPSDVKQYGCFPQRELVAGHRGLKLDSCSGDSGGPLYIRLNHNDNSNGGDENHNESYVLLGATSRGARNGFTVCGDGGIYVRVDQCVDWIESVSGLQLP